jgi:hypothetical protein
MTTSTEPATRSGRARTATFVVLGLTVAQLAVGTFVPGLEQFAGKAFGARLIGYPLMMMLLPAVWWVVRWRRGGTEPLPWTAFCLLMLPFLIDVTGNTLDLYDTVSWWDDANHFVNWFLLCLGSGLLLLGPTRAWPRWAFALLVAGLGALLAVWWELGEWYTFIRHGTELDTAYQDTLGDEFLGTLGGALAGILLAVRSRGKP